MQYKPRIDKEKELLYQKIIADNDNIEGVQYAIRNSNDLYNTLKAVYPEDVKGLKALKTCKTYNDMMRVDKYREVLYSNEITRDLFFSDKSYKFEWAFNDNLDVTNGSFNLTSTNTAVTLEDSDFFPKAAKFDQTLNSRIYFDADDRLNSWSEITASAWIKLSSFDSMQIMCKHDTSNDGEWYLGIYTNTPKDYVRLKAVVVNDKNVRKDCNSQTNLELNKWYHVAFTYDNQFIRIYLNSVLNNIIRQNGNIKNQPINFIIGNNVGSSWRYNGFMNNVKLYNRALTANEIYKEYVDTKVLSYDFSELIRTNEPTVNLMPNADFNDIVTTSWNLSGNMTIEENNNALSNNKCLVIRNPVGAQASISNAINVTPGKTYTLSCYVKHNNLPIGGVRVAIAEISESGTALHIDRTHITLYPKNLNNKWVRFNYIYTVPSDIFSIKIRPVTDHVYTGECFIDNIQVEEKPYATDFTPTNRNIEFVHDEQLNTMVMRFNKTGDKVEFAENIKITSDDLTFSFWVKRISNENVLHGVFLGIKTENSGFFFNNYSLTDLIVWFFGSNPVQSVSFGNVLSMTEFKFVTITVNYPNKTIRRYINGEFLGETVLANSINKPNAKLILGDGYNNEPWQGYLYNVNIYPYKLTDHDIKKKYYEELNEHRLK